MEKEIITLWEENKSKLEDYFKNTPQSGYSSYTAIVEKIIELILNKGDEFEQYSTKIDVIDHGDYQGTNLFIIHKDTYQPGISDYLITHNSYGSCSGCDTLQSIHEYGDGLPNESQIKDYMTLSLHLVQRMKYL